MSISVIILMILIGIFTGIITGLTGASGVMVVVPLVNMLLNFPIHESIGTSLIVDTIAPLSISYTYYKYGNIDIKSGIWIAIGSILGAQLGATLAAGMPEVGLGGTFGVFIVIMGVIIWKRGLKQEFIANKMKKLIKFNTWNQRILTAMILGFGVGLITGILGAGGGVMVLLILIFVLNYPIHVAVGTSALIMAITACSGSLGYALHGNIRVFAGFIIGFSAAGSGVTCARFANKVNEQILAKTIAFIFIILGLIMNILYMV
ncbi:MAG: sulfite exporter TauE/SafE family protein [Deferribacterota bacterium]|nr:sulfite exporter TauE/SafE family protein [Deferribacterota bacterium]